MLIFVFMNWRAQKAINEERDEEELEALVMQLTGVDVIPNTEYVIR